MLNLPPNAKFLLAEQPVNMTLSFDGLIGLVRNSLRADPLSPMFFIFLNKIRDKIKIIYWDNDGFAIWYKRLEQGTFRISLCPAEDGVIHLTRAQLAMLLEGLDFSNARQRKRFSKKIA
jgi:transposase